MRLKLTVAYDGPSFAGWQSQPGGKTVQDLIEAAAKAVCGQNVRIHGAGRTDAGVHALAQVCHADVPPSRLEPASWLRALNAYLPPELRITAAEEAPPDFHARFSASGKIYRYRIYCGSVLPPREYLKAWHLPGPFDDSAAEAACREMVGTHDFSAFSANRGTPVHDTRRTLFLADLNREGPIIEIEFQGNGFLYKMARMLAAAIARCAHGQNAPADIASHFEPNAPKWTHVAPAHGLTLVEVLYGTPSPA